MKVLHVSAECYPAAKAGGLGDVAGALPKYLSKSGFSAAVIIPKYQTKWILAQHWETLWTGSFLLGEEKIDCSIQELSGKGIAFPLFVVDIPGKFDRPGVYLNEEGHGYTDEVERSLSFQRSVLLWLKERESLPRILHCHDHHTGLIPFITQHCPEFDLLAKIPTVFTIHNGEYHGAFGWDKANLLPLYDGRTAGLLDWNGLINPLAAAIKCCWKLTTVSPTYMEELSTKSNGLESLLQDEKAKSIGILNGIDIQVWNPKTDKHLLHPLKRSLSVFKTRNRERLLKRFTIQKDLPLITFIGRLAGEKGAHLLAPMIEQFLAHGGKAAFIILGTGVPYLHTALTGLKRRFPDFVDVALEYNEGLAHQLYAGSDFLLMPSKVEPCGLNQLYAMRYGTIPIARAVGGLKDTVTDIGLPDGSGIQFTYLTAEDAALALWRATDLYKNKAWFEAVRNRIMKIDYSWENSAAKYKALYKDLTAD